MKFKIFLLGIIAVALLSLGCVQQSLGEMGTCMGKCNEACQILKDKNFGFEGYAQLQLEKNTGGLTITCSCMCG